VSNLSNQLFVQFAAFWRDCGIPFLGKRFDPAPGSRYTPKKATKTAPNQTISSAHTGD
jgi:hypothetical protein